ncbi:DUF455 domain protein, partial [Metarhizium hybridum]
MQATSGETTSLRSFAKFLPSHDTAVCLTPPKNLWPSINSVRRLYDKAFEKWPPHVNLVYPFVGPEVLSDAVDMLCQIDLAALVPKTISLQEADYFTHRNDNTLILKPGQYGPSTFAVNWEIKQLAILVRDSSRSMRLWGYVDIQNQQCQQSSSLLGFQLDGSSQETQSQTTFAFDSSTLSWKTALPSTPPPDSIRQLVVASYNVLAEFEWPPDTSRYQGLVSTILSERAAADVLVLQEVTDHFLPYLLQHQGVCARYRFATHGPPGQPGHGPLPNLLNIVVLSKLAFRWNYVPFARKHKGAAVVELAVSHQDPQMISNPQSIILAACHLTQGLADGAVVAKKNELHKLIHHLSTEFPNHPWVIAGDFNLATSVFTIDEARKKGQLSSRGYQSLCEIDSMFANYCLQDAWLLTRLRSGVSRDTVGSSQSPEELFEGEQGATFDPTTNPLAEKAVGGNLNNRPQRYDRIIFNGALSLAACGFNTFGWPVCDTGDGQSVASDHWGIRCLFKYLERDANFAAQNASNSVLTKFRKSPSSLGDIGSLKHSLMSLGCLPTQADQEDRSKAFQLLQSVLCEPNKNQTRHQLRTGPDMVLIPVGSYGLGVWTPESDVDCLCVGNISAKIFFALAISRLRRAKSRGISILRIVRAKTGIMLELSIFAVKFDLQYCAAALVAEKYPDIMNHPATDPAFNLPAQTLSKLKPARDLAYLKRSIPDMAKYRIAHLLLKAWAKSRGLYSSKFGLLGGINISVMLVPICKLLAYNGANVGTIDILTTFFHHYRNFDWRRNMVFDPLFHGTIKYHRTQRESMCLLGWHTPSLNTALNASYSTIHTLSAELMRASDLLSQEGVNWDTFLRGTQPPLSFPELTACNAASFLDAYRSYVKIDARYWGSSPSKGRRFVGWLESRCVMVLVDMNRKLADLVARIWPARFTLNASHSTADVGNEEFNYTYLIGLTWQHDDIENKSREDTQHAEKSLSLILRDFENRLHRDQKYFDPYSCWIMTSLVNAHGVRQFQLDPQPWKDDNAGDTDSEEDLELVDNESDDGKEEPKAGAAISLATPSSDPVWRKASPSVLKAGGSRKLRTAADVMNRLRWDSAIDASNYLVGYEDRFTGAKEKALEQWKSEQTDEEFIPQHRILYFKRKTDGFFVWERSARIDHIFGSGM